MARFSMLSLEEARRAVLPPRQATRAQYREYLRSLGADAAGRLELEPEDHPLTERARLKAAAQAEGINLHIERRGNTIVFWKSDEPPSARGRTARGNGRRRRTR